MLLCHRDCGLESTHINKKGLPCCYSHASKCPSVKKKIGEKNSIALRGRTQSTEHRQNISNGVLNSNRTYNPLTEETKKKLSESLKGKIPWNKGLTENDPRVKAYVIKQRGVPRIKNAPIISTNDPIYNDFKKYRNRVAVRTKKTYNEFKDEINPNKLLIGKAGVEGAYHIDHIVSVKDGFLHSIPIELIASKENLKIIPWQENISKYSNSDKSNIPEQIKQYLKNE